MFIINKEVENTLFLEGNKEFKGMRNANLFGKTVYFFNIIVKGKEKVIYRVEDETDYYHTLKNEFGDFETYKLFSLLDYSPEKRDELLETYFDKIQNGELKLTKKTKTMKTTKGGGKKRVSVEQKLKDYKKLVKKGIPLNEIPAELEKMWNVKPATVKNFLTKNKEKLKKII